MRVAIYARVLLDEKDETKRQYQNPENQLQPIKGFREAMGYEVAPHHVYIDKMRGVNPARPAFREMFQDGKLRRFNGIVVWRLDRFSCENILNALSYIRQLRDRGVWVKSLTECWLDTSPENNSITEIVLSIMAWCTAEERKKISEQTKAGIARKKIRNVQGWQDTKKGGCYLGKKFHSQN